MNLYFILIHYTRILLLIISINLTKAYIVIPLYSLPKNANISSSYELITKMMPLNLYSLAKIGSPPQILELTISEEDIIFSIRKNKCLLKSYYFNKSLSKTFKQNSTNIFYESYAAQDYFYIDNNYNNIEIKNLGFILEKENNDNNNKYNCAILTLNLFRNNVANNDYNFFYELKKLGYINNYVWRIKYIEDKIEKKDNIEGYSIIGEYPHEYEKEKYSILNLRSSMNDMNEKGWNLEFKNITIISNDGNINKITTLSHYMKGIISFSNNYIIGTEEYKSKIDSIFFSQYIQKNICNNDYTVSHYILLTCKKSENFNINNIKQFPSLNFYHLLYNFTFTFTGEDLFLEKNGIYYFLIIFDRYDYRSWTFGSLFLKKYQLIFEHNSKKICFYINKNKQKEKNDDNIYFYNTKILIIILSSIAVASFVIGIIIGKIKFKNKKNKKANELDNDYFIKNSNKNFNKCINDSDEITNETDDNIN